MTIIVGPCSGVASMEQFFPQTQRVLTYVIRADPRFFRGVGRRVQGLTCTYTYSGLATEYVKYIQRGKYMALFGEEDHSLYHLFKILFYL